jgi:hypothetical protein
LRQSFFFGHTDSYSSSWSGASGFLPLLTANRPLRCSKSVTPFAENRRRRRSQTVCNCLFYYMERIKKTSQRKRRRKTPCNSVRIPNARELITGKARESSKKRVASVRPFAGRTFGCTNNRLGKWESKKLESLIRRPRLYDSLIFGWASQSPASVSSN